MFKFLSEMVTEEDVEKIRELLENLSPTELRHVDFLIYLIGYYDGSNVGQHIVKAIMEILMEDERALQNLMQNLG